MADELEPIASVEPETAIEPPVDETVALLEPGEELEASDEGDEAPPEPEDDLEEFDWEGKLIKGPKGLKEGVLRQADYTRKTQEVAAEKRELAAQKAALVQQSQITQEELDARVQLTAIQRELQQYQALDWEKLTNEDLFAAQNHRNRFQDLKEAAAAVSQTLNQRVTQRTETAKQELATRLQETQRFAQEKIPGWTPEVDSKMMEYATKNLGIPFDDLLTAINPKYYEALHYSWIGYQAVHKQAPKAAVSKPALAPLTTVAAKANPPTRKSLSDMNMDEYVAHRNRSRG